MTTTPRRKILKVKIPDRTSIGFPKSGHHCPVCNPYPAKYWEVSEEYARLSVITHGGGVRSAKNQQRFMELKSFMDAKMAMRDPLIEWYCDKLLIRIKVRLNRPGFHVVLHPECSECVEYRGQGHICSICERKSCLNSAHLILSDDVWQNIQYQLRGICLDCHNLMLLTLPLDEITRLSENPDITLASIRQHPLLSGYIRYMYTRPPWREIRNFRWRDEDAPEGRYRTHHDASILISKISLENSTGS